MNKCDGNHSISTVCTDRRCWLEGVNPIIGLLAEIDNLNEVRDVLYKELTIAQEQRRDIYNEYGRQVDGLREFYQSTALDNIKLKTDLKFLLGVVNTLSIQTAIDNTLSYPDLRNLAGIKEKYEGIETTVENP